MSRDHLSHRWAILVCAVLLTLVALPAAAAPVSLRGKIVDYQGKPVPDAEVWLTKGEFDPVMGEREGQALAGGRSDANGEFVLEVDPWPKVRVRWHLPILVAFKAGLAPGWKAAPEPDLTYVIPLEQPQPISGIVQDLQGNPIQGAKVMLRGATRQPLTPRGFGYAAHLWMPLELGERFPVTTDEQGRFQFGLPAGARSLSFAISPPGRGTVSLYAGESSEVRVRVGEAGTVTGRLVADEEGVVGGRIVVLSGRSSAAKVRSGKEYSCRQQATTDEQGRFRIEQLPPAVYGVRVADEEDVAWQAPGNLSLEVEPGAVVEDFEIELHQAWPVTGRLVDADTGEPFAGVEVSADSRQWGKYATTTSDNDGVFRLQVLPGRAELYAFLEYGRFGADENKRTVLVKAGEEIRLEDWPIRRGVSVQGMAVDEQGQPVAGAEVWEGGATGRPRAEDVADSRGAFVLEGLPPDEDVLLMAASGDAVSARATKVNTGSPPDPLRIEVSRGAAAGVGGRVVDERGEPIAGAEVEVVRDVPGRNGTWPLGTLTTGADGGFESQPLMPFYTVSARVSCRGFMPLETEEVTLARGRTQDLGDIVMAHLPGTLAGVVVGPEGVFLAGVTVFNVGDGPQRVTTTTDEQGHFELTGLYEGYAYAFAEGEGYRFNGAGAETGSEELKIVLHPADGPRPRTTVTPPTLDLEHDRWLAQEVAMEGLALTQGRDFRRGKLITALARVNLEVARKLWEEEGDAEDFEGQYGLAEAMLTEDPDAAIDFLWDAEHALMRAMGLLRLGKMLADEQPDLAAEALSLALSAAQSVGQGSYDLAFRAMAASELHKLGRPEAEQVLREAAREAAELDPKERQNAPACLFAAAAVALVDLDAAATLVDGLLAGEWASEVAGSLGGIVAEVAAEHPEKAEDLFSRWSCGDHERVQIAYAMASEDAERALAFARKTDSRNQRGLAIAYVASFLAETDRERAYELIDEAMQVMVQGASRYAYWGNAAAVARVAQLALDIEYPDMQGLVMRALSLRASDRPEMERPQELFYGAYLAQCLAWVDTEAAGQLLEPLVAEIPSLAEKEASVQTIVTAAALVDPDWALEIVRGMADDGPGRTQACKWHTYQGLADCLSLPPDRRIAKYGAGMMWIAGKEEW